MYVPGGEDIGILFSLRIVAAPPVTIALGPNKVINTSSNKKQPHPPLKVTTTTPVTNLSASVLLALMTGWDADPTPSKSSKSASPLFTVLQQSLLLLNSSNPELTTSCWLGYKVRMPYYEGIAVMTPTTILIGRKKKEYQVPAYGRNKSQVRDYL